MRKFKIFLFLYTLHIVYLSDFSFAIASGEIEKTQSNTSTILNFLSTEMLLNVVFAIITIVVTFFFAKLVTGRLTKFLEGNYAGEESGREELVAVLSRTVNISILTVGAAITLTILGIDMGIFLGGLGFGLGFTLKIFLTNFVAGILMVTQGFYHLGDLIEVGSRKGYIRKINALFTAVEQFDGIIYYIPNVTFLEQEVCNYNTNDKRRLSVSIGVDFKTDILYAKKILLGVIDNFPNILQTPSSDVLVEEMQDSSIKLTLRFWINSTDKFITLRSNVTETINHAFNQAGIVIPYPQVTLSNREDFNLKVKS
ncbi:MAG: mechanosensitive ion channel [Candidatus Gracilibacteria bacterium]